LSPLSAILLALGYPLVVAIALAGMRVVHDIEFPGEANVDHLLVGPDWDHRRRVEVHDRAALMNHKAIGGSSHGWYIADAKRGVRMALRALAEAGHPDR